MDKKNKEFFFEIDKVFEPDKDDATLKRIAGVVVEAKRLAASRARRRRSSSKELNFFLLYFGFYFVL